MALRDAVENDEDDEKSEGSRGTSRSEGRSPAGVRRKYYVFLGTASALQKQAYYHRSVPSRL